MKILAIIALALMQLTPLGTNNHAGRWLESLAKDDRQPSAHHLLAQLPHQALPQPVKTGSESLSLGASSVMAVDLTTMQTLYENNADSPRPIASITKLASALVILHNHSLDETVTVPALPSYAADDVKLNLTQGEQFKLRDILAAMMIPSANDAADTAAIYDSGTIKAFSAKMNGQLAEWGIKGAHFTNASGLSDTDNYATARSLTKIAKLVLTNPELSRFVGTSSAQISDLSGRRFSLVSTDQLLGDGRVTGIKTGFTAASGECFVSLSHIKGHQVITVVLNSPDRFGETTVLDNWLERNYQWQ